MSKRPRESPESSPSPSTRRFKLSYATSSPTRASTSKQPFTPRSHHVNNTPHSAPSDSPSNPFGLKRSLLALDLPRVTSFGQHIPLRLQVATDADARVSSLKRNRGGIYRVVQVPKTYTFRHLHKLILYLFASDMHAPNSTKAQPPPHRTQDTLLSSKRPTVLSRKAAGKARAHPETATWGGHYFEVQKQITIFPETKRPGVIQPGSKTVAKLSSVRDRQLFRDLYDPYANASTFLPTTLEDEDTDREDWTWEAEDDFTLSHVWPNLPEMEKGIVYHHSPSVCIHITVNTLPIPVRKGRGNTPFVFLAQGSTGSLIQIAHTVPDENGNETYSAVDDASDSLALPLPKAFLERWNNEGAFHTFLRREADRERALRITRSLVLDDANLASPEPSTIPSSDGLDPVSLSSCDDFDSDAMSIYSTKSDSYVYPSVLSAITPFPTNPFRRKRLERLGRRMEKLTRTNLRDVMSSDEEKDKKSKSKSKTSKKPGERRGEAKEIVWPASVPPKARKVAERMKGRRPKASPSSRRTLDLDVTREVIMDLENTRDPFGDEAELCA
ncbi:hypothetical protein BDW22DRAFT_417871 [Trametopsis cervina]|nr:hypothetical protein BDW22DRAFT_417871 [Trametopsis cervina]